MLDAYDAWVVFGTWCSIQILDCWRDLSVTLCLFHPLNIMHIINVWSLWELRWWCTIIVAFYLLMSLIYVACIYICLGAGSSLPCVWASNEGAGFPYLQQFNTGERWILPRSEKAVLCFLYICRRRLKQPWKRCAVFFQAHWRQM